MAYVHIVDELRSSWLQDLSSSDHCGHFRSEPEDGRYLPVSPSLSNSAFEMNKIYLGEKEARKQRRKEGREGVREGGKEEWRRGEGGGRKEGGKLTLAGLVWHRRLS